MLFFIKCFYINCFIYLPVLEIQRKDQTFEEASCFVSWMMEMAWTLVSTF